MANVGKILDASFLSWGCKKILNAKKPKEIKNDHNISKPKNY